MDQVMNKLGTYWFSKRADKEISSVGDDLNVTCLIVSLLYPPGFPCFLRFNLADYHRYLSLDRLLVFHFL